MLLYRYNKLTDRIVTYLNDRNLFFSNPLNFNDPFDCDLTCLDIHAHDAVDTQFHLYINALQDRIDFINKFITHFSVRIKDNDDPVMERYYFDDPSEVYFKEIVSLNEELRILKDCPKEKRSQTIIDSWEIKKKYIINTMGVLCFSKLNSNILMWSHYANNHKGVCFEYDTSYRPIINWKKYKFHQVIYKKERTIDVLKRGFRDAFYDIITTKAPDWEYEQEYRLITIKGSGFQKNSIKNLKGIIFGARIRENNNEIISRLFTGLRNMDSKRKSVKKLEYFAAFKDEKNFSINKETT